MNDKTTGITFDETMEGGFSLNETDTQTGCDRGEVDGNVLAMHARVEIPDIDEFIANPEHLGKLSGTIDFPPFTKGIPAPGGVFNLFSPTEDPTCKFMVYELGFEHDGRPYYLAGRKKVKNEMVTHMWKATTTLYTHLHEGDNKEGNIVGAGILTLGIRQLVDLVSTMGVTNAVSAAERTETIVKFGRFFMGDLWDSYVKHARG